MNSLWTEARRISHDHLPQFTNICLVLEGGRAGSFFMWRTSTSSTSFSAGINFLAIKKFWLVVVVHFIRSCDYSPIKFRENPLFRKDSSSSSSLAIGDRNNLFLTKCCGGCLFRRTPVKDQAWPLIVHLIQILSF
jgi:hypothetical protein